MKEVVKLVAVVAMTIGLIDVMHTMKDKVDELFLVIFLFSMWAFFLVVLVAAA